MAEKLSAAIQTPHGFTDEIQLKKDDTTYSGKLELLKEPKGPDSFKLYLKRDGRCLGLSEFTKRKAGLIARVEIPGFFIYAAAQSTPTGKDDFRKLKFTLQAFSTANHARPAWVPAPPPPPLPPGVDPKEVLEREFLAIPGPHDSGVIA